MDHVETTLRIVMIVSTTVLFGYGLLKRYDTLELFIYNLYFISLMLYLIKTNFMR
jgi:hypothetical protein